MKNNLTNPAYANELQPGQTDQGDSRLQEA